MREALGTRSGSKLWSGRALLGAVAVAIVMVAMLQAVRADQSPGSTVALDWSAGASPSEGATPSAGVTPLVGASWSARPTPSTGGSASASSTRSVGATQAEGGSTATDVDWRAVLVELDRRRAGALQARDQAGLAKYAAPGSAAWQSDARLIAELAKRSLRPVGLATRIVAVEDVRLGDEGASIKVVDERGSYQLVDRSGEVKQRVAGTGQRRWRVKLVSMTRGGASAKARKESANDAEPRELAWRVAEVQPVS